MIVVVDTVLYNTKLYFHGDLFQGGIAINDGKILKIAKESNLPKAAKKINLKGNITLPGLIDAHVHLRDQQLAYKETFKTGTAAAAAGGITSVIDMPNNKPITMDVDSFRQRVKLAENEVLVNVGFNSAFPHNLDEISELVKSGVIAFKVYLSNGLGGVNVDNDESLVRAFRSVSELNVPIMVHAEDRLMIQKQKNKFVSSGKLDLMSYVISHSPEAEAKSIERIISLVKQHNVSVHFCHLSSALGLFAIESAKKEGLPVTCEVTPHNLLLSTNQYDHSGSLALTDPPLRQPNDLEILWGAIKQGSIDLIASDHAPHTIAEKTANSIWDVSPGVPGLETTLLLLLNQVNKRHLSMAELVRVTAESPAVLFKLSNRGFLDEGNWADIVVVDLKQETIIDSSLFQSKAKYSPFEGMHTKGKPVKTFVNGDLVMDDGEILSDCISGKIIRNNVIG